MTPYIVHAPQHALSAVVFDTPHSGVALPDHFRFACARGDLMHLHDPHVEKLLERVPASGSPVLEAAIHRTVIDLNRFTDEINPEIIDGGWPYPVRKTRHTEQKLGLFPLCAGPRSKRDRMIYDTATPLRAGDAHMRIEQYHRPYYAALRDLMNAASRAHGHALHINVHSFYRRAEHKTMLDDMILGDMNGTTCSPVITGLTHAFLKANGLRVGFNGPDFSGGALIQSTSDFSIGQHSLQIEIARDLYMNADTLAYDRVKGQRVQNLLTGLAHMLARCLGP